VLYTPSRKKETHFTDKTGDEGVNRSTFIKGLVQTLFLIGPKIGQRWNNDRDFAVAVRYAQKFLQIILR
jgi:hypothetical protein